MKKKKKKPSIGLAKFFDSHVREKQYAYSMSTIANYGTALRSLMRYLGQDDIAVDALTDDTVAGYQRWLLEQGVCLNTVSCYMRSLRSLCGKAADSGLPPRQEGIQAAAHRLAVIDPHAAVPVDIAAEIVLSALLYICGVNGAHAQLRKDREQQLPDPLLKGAAPRIQLREKAGVPPAEIEIQP